MPAVANHYLPVTSARSCFADISEFKKMNCTVYKKFQNSVDQRKCSQTCSKVMFKDLKKD